MLLRQKLVLQRGDISMGQRPNIPCSRHDTLPRVVLGVGEPWLQRMMHMLSFGKRSRWLLTRLPPPQVQLQAPQLAPHQARHLSRTHITLGGYSKKIGSVRTCRTSLFVGSAARRAARVVHWGHYARFRRERGCYEADSVVSCGSPSCGHLTHHLLIGFDSYKSRKNSRVMSGPAGSGLPRGRSPVLAHLISESVLAHK